MRRQRKKVSSSNHSHVVVLYAVTAFSHIHTQAFAVLERMPVSMALISVNNTVNGEWKQIQQPCNLLHYPTM